jgi:type II secretory pathway pseudopilin PulG
VVIAIIAILAGLLFPTLSKAKDRAANTVDLNNNRQIMLATQMYATDNEDYLPYPNWGRTYPGWLYGANLPTGPFNATTYSRQVEKLREGQLWPYLGEPRTFMCPFDKTNSSTLRRLFSQRGQYISSYVMNGAVGGFGRLADRHPHNAFRISDFNPSAILLWEADGQTPFYFNDGSSFPDEGISQRHGGGSATSSRVDVKGGATVGLFGGSAEFMKYKEFYEEAGFQRSSGGRRPGRLWCAPDSRNGT